MYLCFSQLRRLLGLLLGRRLVWRRRSLGARAHNQKPAARSAEDGSSITRVEARATPLAARRPGRRLVEEKSETTKRAARIISYFVVFASLVSPKLGRQQLPSFVGDRPADRRKQARRSTGSLPPPPLIGRSVSRLVSWSGGSRFENRGSRMRRRRFSIFN